MLKRGLLLIFVGLLGTLLVAQPPQVKAGWAGRQLTPRPTLLPLPTDAPPPTATRVPHPEPKTPAATPLPAPPATPALLPIAGGGSIGRCASLSLIGLGAGLVSVAWRKRRIHPRP